MGDDTGKPAVENEEEPAFSEAQQNAINGMLEKQTDRLTSHFGRIVTKQFEEKFKPELKKDLDPEKFKEQIYDHVMDGDVEVAVNKVLDKKRQEEQVLTEKKAAAITEELGKYEKQEFFKEIKDDIKKLANDASSKGYPPGPAVELAYEKASKQFLRNRDPEYKLQMSRGGTPPVKRKAKLPDALKSAARRDIADGLFKDEDDYLAQLPSAMKEKYGI